MKWWEGEGVGVGVVWITTLHLNRHFYPHNILHAIYHFDIRFK